MFNIESLNIQTKSNKTDNYVKPCINTSLTKIGINDMPVDNDITYTGKADLIFYETNRFNPTGNYSVLRFMIEDAPDGYIEAYINIPKLKPDGTFIKPLYKASKFFGDAFSFFSSLVTCIIKEYEPVNQLNINVKQLIEQCRGKTFSVKIVEGDYSDKTNRYYNRFVVTGVEE